MDSVDIAIVGAGLVGTPLAQVLSQQGWSVALLDAAGLILESDAKSSNVDLALALNVSGESSTTTKNPKEKDDSAQAKDTGAEDFSNAGDEPVSEASAENQSTEASDKSESSDESENFSEGEPESETENESEASGGISLDASSDKKSVSINAKNGVQRRSGSKPTQEIAGADMRIPTTQSSDGSVTAQLPLSVNSSSDEPLVLVDSSGNPVPDWVKVDPLSGTLEANPPENFKGVLDVVVLIPKSDGGVNKVGVRIEK